MVFFLYQRANLSVKKNYFAGLRQVAGEFFCTHLKIKWARSFPNGSASDGPDRNEF